VEKGQKKVLKERIKNEIEWYSLVQMTNGVMDKSAENLAELKQQLAEAHKQNDALLAINSKLQNRIIEVVHEHNGMIGHLGAVRESLKRRGVLLPDPHPKWKNEAQILIRHALDLVRDSMKSNTSKTNKELE